MVAAGFADGPAVGDGLPRRRRRASVFIARCARTSTAPAISGSSQVSVVNAAVASASAPGSAGRRALARSSADRERVLSEAMTFLAHEERPAA
jgi:hypothetical protein